MRFIKFLDSEPDQPRINHVVRPFQRFTAQEASAGIVLLVCAIAACPLFRARPAPGRPFR